MANSARPLRIGVLGAANIARARRLLGVQPPISTKFVDPRQATGGPPAVVLSILGYLVVPAIIGAITSLIFGGVVQRSIYRRQAPLLNLELRVRDLENRQST